MSIINLIVHSEGNNNFLHLLIVNINLFIQTYGFTFIDNFTIMYDYTIQKFLWKDLYNFQYFNIKEKLNMRIIKISEVINDEHNQFYSSPCNEIIISFLLNVTMNLLYK